MYTRCALRWSSRGVQVECAKPPSLKQRRPLSKSACDKLTSTVAKWIAKSCRPINIVEDEGFPEVVRVATGDSSIKTPQSRTIMTKIHELYEAEKKKKENDLAATKHQALTGDHWTSVSNDNYLGVTAHLITDEWKLNIVYIYIVYIHIYIYIYIYKNISTV